MVFLRMRPCIALVAVKKTRVFVCFSCFCYPPLVVDVTVFPLYLSTYTLIFCFPSVDFSVFLPNQKAALLLSIRCLISASLSSN